MKNRKVLLTLSILSILSIGASLFSGCAKSKSGKDVVDASNTGKGRYVEWEVSLPEEVTPIRMDSKEDGSQIIFDGETNHLLTSDEKVRSWTSETPAWVGKIKNLALVDEIAYSKQGDCIVEYMESSNDSTKENDSTFKYQPKYAFVKADGTITSLNLDFGDTFAGEFAFSPDGRLFAYDYFGKCYEVDVENGKLTTIFSLVGAYQSFSVTKHYVIGMDNDQLGIYDLEKKKQLETPKALSDFLDKQKYSNTSDNKEAYNCLFQEDTKGNLYIVTANGIFRYVMDGTTVEQLMDGELVALEKPSNHINSFMVDKDGVFFVLFSEGTLMRYKYDPKADSTPAQMLRVYSLENNETVKQAVSEFHKTNPDLQVDYEVGMTGEDGVTYEDALKNLNTEILSEHGPDIIIMDGLSLNNYIEKGVLLDMSKDLDEIEKSLHLQTNITRSFENDKGIYTVPAKFSMSLLLGEKDTLKKITDLKSWADQEEVVGAKYPKDYISFLYKEDEILKVMLGFGGNDCNQGKEIDEEKLTELLEQGKRIYTVERSKFTKKEIDYLKNDEELDMESFGESLSYGPGGRALDIKLYGSHMVQGVFNSFEGNLNSALTIAKEKKLDYRIGLNKNDTKMIPSCMLSVAANSKQKKEAISFIKTVLSSEVQDVDVKDGFSVNQDSLKKLYEKQEGEEVYGSGFSMARMNGLPRVTIQVMWPKKDQTDVIKAAVDKLDTPIVMDHLTEEAILEYGPAALNGEMTVEETVKKISEKLKIRANE